jgi:hypothetical protein
MLQQKYYILEECFQFLLIQAGQFFSYHFVFFSILFSSLQAICDCKKDFFPSVIREIFPSVISRSARRFFRSSSVIVLHFNAAEMFDFCNRRFFKVKIVSLYHSSKAFLDSCRLTSAIRTLLRAVFSSGDNTSI